MRVSVHCLYVLRLVRKFLKWRYMDLISFSCIFSKFFLRTLLHSQLLCTANIFTVQCVHSNFENINIIIAPNYYNYSLEITLIILWETKESKELRGQGWVRHERNRCSMLMQNLKRCIALFDISKNIQ